MYTILVDAWMLTLIVGGTGLFACQLAKNIFKAGKVITTVSTAKVPKVKELLGEGVVDESKCILPFFPPVNNLEIKAYICRSHRLQEI